MKRDKRKPGGAGRVAEAFRPGAQSRVGLVSLVGHGDCVKRFALLALMVFLAGSGPRCFAQGHALRIEVEHRFLDRTLVPGALSLTNAAGNRFSITRLDYLLSELSLKRADGTWLDSRDWFAYLSATSSRTTSTTPGMPAERFTGIRFKIGVPPAVNAADPNHYAADHELHPQVNGLHWGWQGGYVFLALEGHWLQADGSTGGYSYHVANDENLMTVELPVEFDTSKDTTVTLRFDLGRVFEGRQPIDIAAQPSTHSRDNDPLATRLKANIEGAFAIARVTSDLFHPNAGPASLAAVPAGTQPFPLRIAQRLPKPPLPADNPLTVEGVGLGRRLFFEKRLSRDDSVACAGCHLPEQAFTDGPRRFSLGVDNKVGTRNAMSLHNLIWADSFFWDGRARRLREQALVPIADPVEMDLPLVVALENLRTDPDYPGLFARAFGSPGIDAPRLGLAFEQFLISLISQNAKFDRAVRGEVEFTTQEKRGFELFVTENDPARGLSGADCFHCHGGSLFTNHRFANNGLDREFRDAGRFQVTGDEADRGKFKTPSLRNVELTAPYMHDGRFATLEEVVEHYDNGVQSSATLDPNLAKHLPSGLKLSDADKAALVAFLNALTERGFGHAASTPP